jgi:hypothetical protein
MVGALDLDEHGDAEPDLVLVDQRHPAQDHAVGLEPLDALPARALGQADALCDLGRRKRSVPLEDGEDAPVIIVEHGHGENDFSA